MKLAKERKVGDAFDATTRQGTCVCTLYCYLWECSSVCRISNAFLFFFFYRAQHKTGPQVDDDTFTKVMHYIETGKKEGATLATGGNRIGNVGYFIEPTVFTNVTDNMAIATDEVIRVTPV